MAEGADLIKLYLLFSQARSFLSNATNVAQVIKWSSLQKRECKFIPKNFYEIDPRFRAVICLRPCGPLYFLNLIKYPNR
jgi:hypothetical protein